VVIEVRVLVRGFELIRGAKFVRGSGYRKLQVELEVEEVSVVVFLGFKLVAGFACSESRV
jgi:hypothetical protein